jgi:molybdopterin converting factor small subunit
VRIRVRFFGLLREKLGTGSQRDVDAGAAVEAVWTAIAGRNPDVRDVPVRFAVNGEYVPNDHRLAEGDELACFPPVSGGSGCCIAARKCGTMRRNGGSELGLRRPRLLRHR